NQPQFTAKGAVMKVRTLLILFIVAALITISATATLAQTNTTIPMLPGAPQQIKVGFGDQMSPRVPCNIVSYTNDDFEGNSTIKYFDFATNTEHVVPGNGLDRLSETEG